MRAQAIAAQKKLGRKTVVALPVHYPRELFTAMDVHVVELWGPPGAPRGPGAGRIQPYVCAIVRNALAFLASGGADAADAVLFPHTCDSLQGLATLITDLGGWSKPVLRYHQAKGEERRSARAFGRAELSRLTGGLERLTGRELDIARLEAAIALHAEIDGIKRALLSRRAFLDLSDPALYRLLRRGEFLWPEDHLAELEDARRGIGKKRAQQGVPLMITGYVPEPMAIFDHLASAGAFVVADDYAAVGRRVPPHAPARGGDPLEGLAAQTFAMPPCPTRVADSRRRMEYLRALYLDSRAAGVIVHVPKFCEPESFDVPAIRRLFAAIGAPLLHLEGELETDLPAQAVTRLEAFVEMAAAAGSSP
jgi:benzoyl-CoA reductase/2-hydroxyglutaryl-CoA dehydratase subunit BcrC/BadD/HgdB